MGRGRGQGVRGTRVLGKRRRNAGRPTRGVLRRRPRPSCRTGRTVRRGHSPASRSDHRRYARRRCGKPRCSHSRNTLHTRRTPRFGRILSRRWRNIDGGSTRSHPAGQISCRGGLRTRQRRPGQRSGHRSVHPLDSSHVPTRLSRRDHRMRRSRWGCGYDRRHSRRHRGCPHRHRKLRESARHTALMAFSTRAAPRMDYTTRLHGRLPDTHRETTVTRSASRIESEARQNTGITAGCIL